MGSHGQGRLGMVRWDGMAWNGMRLGIGWDAMGWSEDGMGWSEDGME